jgi:hypothetical protein
MLRYVFCQTYGKEKGVPIYDHFIAFLDPVYRAVTPDQVEIALAAIPEIRVRNGVVIVD